MRIKIVALLAAVSVLLAACAPASETITIGATEGLYAKVAEKALVPALGEQGYKAEVKKYKTLAEPNTELAEGKIEANLFQQKIALNQFNEEYGENLSAIQEVPSVELGLYSHSITSLDDIPNGVWVTIPNDELGTARALRFLQQQGLIALEEDAPYMLTEKHIESNPKKLQIQPVLPAQLIASLASGDLAIIPDNYIIADELDIKDALAKEQIGDELRYVIAVRDEDRETEFAKALKEAAQSETFQKIIDKEFQNFGN